MERTLGRLELLRLAGTADTTSKSAERNDLLVLLDITEVGVGLRELEAYTPSNSPFSPSYRPSQNYAH